MEFFFFDIGAAQNNRTRDSRNLVGILPRGSSQNPMCQQISFWLIWESGTDEERERVRAIAHAFNALYGAEADATLGLIGSEIAPVGMSRGTYLRSRRSRHPH
jgi:hypothetical protein